MATTQAQVRAYLDPEEPDYKAAAAALGPEALPVLEALVQGADPLLASKAAYLASLIPAERAARVLEQAARSAHPTVRVAAAAGLQKQPEVTDDVAVDLMTDQDQGVRKVAAKATRGRMTPALRDRIAERASSDRDPARRAAARAAMEHAPAKSSEPDGGGGDSPDDSVKGTSAPGEGGGDIGNAASVRYTVSDVGDESGGGGDLGGGFTSDDRGTNDGPDGGGSIDGESSGRGDESSHGGGSF